MTDTLDLTSDILELVDSARRSMSRPRVHPNGFVQLDIAPATRLHFWPEDPHQFVKSMPHPIHDHVFAMRSTVLKGVMWQTVYRVQLEHGGEPTHEILTARYKAPDHSELNGRSGVLVKLDELPEDQFHIDAGDTYLQPAFTFHTSVQAGLTVTLMERQRSWRGDPRILLPIGEEPLVEFDRHAWPDDEQLWAFIESVL